MGKGTVRLKGQHTVIVGNGIAGNSAASAIRRFNTDIDVTIISDENSPLYSPCAFYKYLSGEIDKQKLFLKKLENYSREGVNVVFGQKASEVNVNAREVRAGNEKLHFDKLILATGSTALLLPIKGVDKRGVFALKTINDAEALFNYPAKKVAIVGSGPIGVEVAIAFRERGLEVSIIEILNRILPRLFDNELAVVLRGIIEDHGIKVLTKERVTEILGNEIVRGLTTDKREIACDMVIIAAGTRPNTELAKQMGLEISNLGGIKTDDYMMTSIEDVYACGDCVESKDIITGNSTLSLLWHNAKRQGWTSGCNCVGMQKKFIGSLDATTVEIFGTLASSIGKSAASFSSRSEYDIIEKNYDSTYFRLVVVGDRLVGAQLINKPEHAGMLSSMMWRRDNLVELRKVVLNEKLLLMKPWRYWISEYVKK